MEVFWGLFFNKLICKVGRGVARSSVLEDKTEWMQLFQETIEEGGDLNIQEPRWAFKHKDRPHGKDEGHKEGITSAGTSFPSCVSCSSLTARLLLCSWLLESHFLHVPREYRCRLDENKPPAHVLCKVTQWWCQWLTALPSPSSGKDFAPSTLEDAATPNAPRRSRWIYCH